MTDSAGKSAGFGERVRAFLESHDSLNRVAHDPALTAELLLLVRMSFADKSVEPAEAEAFAAVCTRLLGLHADELGDIFKYLNDFGYETSNAQAAEMLAGLSEARRARFLIILPSWPRRMVKLMRASGACSRQRRTGWAFRAKTCGKSAIGADRRGRGAIRV
jgi:uncharacterized tellurite resistance protein B-like protein